MTRENNRQSAPVRRRSNPPNIGPLGQPPPKRPRYSRTSSNIKASIPWRTKLLQDAIYKLMHSGNRSPAAQARLRLLREDLRDLQNLAGRSDYKWAVANNARQELTIQHAKEQNNAHAARLARGEAEDRAFLAWRTRQARQMANLEIGPVPKPTSPQFQSWVKTLFSTKKFDAMPTLLRYMKTPPGKSAHQALGDLMGNSADDACKSVLHPNTSSIQAHQAVVHVMAQLRAANKIDTAGLLVVHSTGGGKTLSCLAVMLAFWNTGVPLILVSTNDNRQTNDLNNFAKLAMLMFGDFTDERNVKPFAKPPGASDRYWEDPKHVTAVAEIIKKRLQTGIRALMTSNHLTPVQKNRTIYTFAELGNDLMITDKRPPALDLRKDTRAVFIIDEIQYLVSPPPTEQMYVQQYKVVYDALAKTRNPHTTWCVGLTATPGETKQEVIDIMNVVLGRERRATVSDSLSQLHAKCMGHISYAHLLGDRSRFASVRMRMLCAYLQDADGQKSYYHDAYFHKLHKSFSGHERYPENARRFVSSVHNSLGLAGRVQTGAQRFNKNHYWDYASQKAEFLHKPLRMMTLFVKLDKKEFEAMRQRHEKMMEEEDPDDNNSRKRRKEQRRTWPPQELFIATSASTAPLNNQNEDSGNEAMTDYNKTWLERGAAAENKRLRKSSRVQTKHLYHRFLLSPKITQFLAFVYADLHDKTPRTKRGIHYVYTTSPTAALLVAHTLERVLGMPQLKNAKAYDALRRPYFVMLDDVSSQLDILGRFKTGRAADAMRDLRRFVDAPANAYGDQVKVVIATNKSFKGVDLKHIRYLHLLDPLVNFRDFVQFVGRGPRYCSHAAHPVKNRFVEVVLYRLLYSPGNPCASGSAALPDCFVWNQAYQRYFGKGQYQDIEDNVIWKASVDYELFRDNLHKSRDSLKTMITKLKCNTLKPISHENAPNANYGNRRLPDGFSHLIQEAKRRLKKQVANELKASQNAPAPMRSRAKLAKELQNAQNNSVRARIMREMEHAEEYPNYKKKYARLAKEVENKLGGLARLQQIMSKHDDPPANLRADENVLKRAHHNAASRLAELQAKTDLHKRYLHNKKLARAKKRIDNMMLNVAANNVHRVSNNWLKQLNTPNSSNANTRTNAASERRHTPRVRMAPSTAIANIQKAKREALKPYKTDQLKMTAFKKLLKTNAAAAREKFREAAAYFNFDTALRAARKIKNAALQQQAVNKARANYPSQALYFNTKQREKAIRDNYNRRIAELKKEQDAQRTKNTNAPKYREDSNINNDP